MQITTLNKLIRHISIGWDQWEENCTRLALDLEDHST